MFERTWIEFRGEQTLEIKTWPKKEAAPRYYLFTRFRDDIWTNATYVTDHVVSFAESMVGVQIIPHSGLHPNQTTLQDYE